MSSSTASLAVDAHGGEIVEDGLSPHDRREGRICEANSRPRPAWPETRWSIKRVHGAQQVLVGHALGHRRHRDRLQPAQAAELAVRRAQAVEHHRADQRLDIELALTGAQGAPKGTVEAKSRPQLVPGEDVPKARLGAWLISTLAGSSRPAARQSTPDQGVELACPCHRCARDWPDAMPRLAGLVAIGLDDLQVTPPSAPVDAHEHAYIMPLTGHYCEYRKADRCEDTRESRQGLRDARIADVATMPVKSGTTFNCKTLRTCADNGSGSHRSSAP